MLINYNGFIYIRNISFTDARKIVQNINCLHILEDDRTDDCNESAFDVIVNINVPNANDHIVSHKDVIESLKVRLEKSAEKLGLYDATFDIDNYHIEVLEDNITMLKPTEKYPNETHYFIHGLCHTLALQLNKELGLPLLVVTDYDVDVSSDTLTYVCNKLPNGKYIDMENIYDSLDDVRVMLKKEFTELTQFKINEYAEPTKLLTNLNKDLPIANFSGDAVDSDNYTIYLCYQYAINFVKHYLLNLKAHEPKTTESV